MIKTSKQVSSRVCYMEMFLFTFDTGLIKYFLQKYLGQFSNILFCLNKKIKTRMKKLWQPNLLVLNKIGSYTSPLIGNYLAGGDSLFLSLYNIFKNLYGRDAVPESMGIVYEHREYFISRLVESLFASSGSGKKKDYIFISKADCPCNNEQQTGGTHGDGPRPVKLVKKHGHNNRYILLREDDNKFLDCDIARVQDDYNLKHCCCGDYSCYPLCAFFADKSISPSVKERVLECKPFVNLFCVKACLFFENLTLRDMIYNKGLKYLFAWNPFLMFMGKSRVLSLISSKISYLKFLQPPQALEYYNTVLVDTQLPKYQLNDVSELKFVEKRLVSLTIEPWLIFIFKRKGLDFFTLGSVPEMYRSKKVCLVALKYGKSGGCFSNIPLHLRDVRKIKNAFCKGNVFTANVGEDEEEEDSYSSSLVRRKRKIRNLYTPKKSLSVREIRAKVCYDVLGRVPFFIVENTLTRCSFEIFQQCGVDEVFFSRRDWNYTEFLGLCLEGIPLDKGRVYLADNMRNLVLFFHLLLTFENMLAPFVFSSFFRKDSFFVGWLYNALSERLFHGGLEYTTSYLKKLELNTSCRYVYTIYRTALENSPHWESVLAKNAQNNKNENPLENNNNMTDTTPSSSPPLPLAYSVHKLMSTKGYSSLNFKDAAQRFYQVKQQYNTLRALKKKKK